MKRPILIFTVGFILIIVGIQYFNCIPFKMKKIDSAVSNCKATAVILQHQGENENYSKYIVKIKKSNYSNIDKTKILLNLKKPIKKKLHIGDVILLNCEIELPSEKRNYKGYDYKLYLKTLGIQGIAKIEEKDIQKIDEEYTIISKLKERIIENINRILPQKTSGLCIGILLGDTNYITDDIKENFENSNLSHMLAVSGAHVSYLLIGITKCLKKVDNRFQKIIIIVFLLFFIKLTGSTSSVTRAGIMVIMGALATLFHKKSDVLNNISISCLIILIINPYNIYNLGFQLSFAGTIGIILFYDIVENYINKIR